MQPVFNNCRPYHPGTHVADVALQLVFSISQDVVNASHSQDCFISPSHHQHFKRCYKIWLVLGCVNIRCFTDHCFHSYLLTVERAETSVTSVTFWIPLVSLTTVIARVKKEEI